MLEPERLADAHEDLFTASAPDDPPEDEGLTANTSTNPHRRTHHTGHIPEQA